MRYVYTPHEEIMRRIYNDPKLLHRYLTLEPTYLEEEE